MDIEDILKIKEESDALTTRALSLMNQVSLLTETSDLEELVEITIEMDGIAKRLHELRDAALLIQSQVNGSNIIPFPAKK